MNTSIFSNWFFFWLFHSILILHCNFFKQRPHGGTGLNLFIMFLIPYWHRINSNKITYSLWTTWQCVSMIPSLSKPEFIINNFDRELATYIEVLNDMSSRARGVVVSTSVGWSWRPRFDSWRAQNFLSFWKIKNQCELEVVFVLK